MLLGISDILAMQAVDRPQNVLSGGSATNASGAAMRFGDYLNNKPFNSLGTNRPDISRKVVNNYNKVLDRPVYQSGGTQNSGLINTNNSNFNNNQSNNFTPSINNQQQNVNPTASIKNLSPDQRVKLSDLYDSLQKGTDISAEDMQALQNILLQFSGGATNAGIATPSALTKDDLLSALSQLQSGSANAEAQPQAVTSASNQLQAAIASLSDAQLKMLNDVLSRLSANGIPAGLSANDVIAQIVAQLGNAKSDSSVTADDILQKINSANSGLTKSPSLMQMISALLGKQPETLDINSIAKKIIDAATKEAAKPQVAASTIKAQINDVKQSDENNNTQLQNNNMFSAVDSGIIQPASAQVLAVPQQVQNLPVINSTQHVSLAQVQNNNNPLPVQKNIDASLAINSTSNIISNVPQVNTFAINSLEQAVIQPSDLKADDSGAVGNIGGLAAGLSSGISSENFVKFQGMLSDTQSSLNSSANSTKFGAGSAVDVMAQIKFSMETGSNGNNTSNISVQLHPKELGKVDISIQLSNDGKTHVMVMAEKTDTLNMLQKESSSLKDMLTDALKTDSGSLNFSFQQSGSDSWRQFANNNSGMISRSSPDLGLLSNEIIMPQGYSYNMTATQGLDIRV